MNRPDSTAKNVQKIAELKLSSCGIEVMDIRKKLRLRNCGVAFAEQHFFKSCGIAIAEVLPSSCGIAIVDSTPNSITMVLSMAGGNPPASSKGPISRS